MDIKIDDFTIDQKNNRVGYVDFTVTHSEDKKEIFRGIAYFEKDKSKWISLPVVKRNEKFKPVYERTPPLKPIFDKVLELIELRLASLR